MIYAALFQLVLEYGIIDWEDAYKNVLMSIETIKKFVLKIIMHKPHKYSYELLWQECGVHPVGKLFCRTAAIYCCRSKLAVQTVNTRTVNDKKFQIPLYPQPPASK